jgi:adenylosuccinate synthase
MSVTVVVGGQYGSEGKGKVLAHLAKRDGYEFNVRCGGPNSGHTVNHLGKKMGLLQVPCAVANDQVRLLTAPGGVVNPRMLLKELEECQIGSERYGIDYRTAIITDEASERENSLALHESCGSTRSGTGIGVVRRILRGTDHVRAEGVTELKPYLTDVPKELGEGLDQGEGVLVEGTQGYGLSVYLARHFPFMTSRDTSAAGFIGECGISPMSVRKVVMILRTFPIRVGGNSGPLHSEISWEEIQKESGCPELREEITTVTKRLRRVGRFDYDMVNEAITVNRPTEIALMGADYLDYRDFGQTDPDKLSERTRDLIEGIETTWNVPVTMVGVGPDPAHIIDRGGS